MSMIILQNMYILIPMNAAISPNLGPNWYSLESHNSLSIQGHGTGAVFKIEVLNALQTQFGPSKYTSLSQNDPS